MDITWHGLPVCTCHRLHTTPCTGNVSRINYSNPLELNLLLGQEEENKTYHDVQHERQDLIFISQFVEQSFYDHLRTEEGMWTRTGQEK